MDIVNNKEGKPLAYYTEKFRNADPSEIALRTALPWDGAHFTCRLLGHDYQISWPEFAVTGEPEVNNEERILFLRYLLDGRAASFGGRYLTYREFPWGEVYLRQFTGRCIQRFAFTYGQNPALLEKIMACLPAERVPQSDAGYQLELIPGLTMRLLLWLGDEEFQPSGQILFSDNFRYAFTAEDMACVGDIVLGRMKRIGTSL